MEKYSRLSAAAVVIGALRVILWKLCQTWMINTSKMTENRGLVFGLGLACKAKGHSCHTKNQLRPKPFTEKTSKSAKYPWSLRYKKKDPLK